ncbi:MAG: chaperonin GroEL [Chloroflexi bacterium]|nr:chaperonin GroEL [Chloroflexota bacterium]
MAEKFYRDVLLKPRARVALARGVDIMASVLRVTLGPMARAVVMAPVISTRTPELLTDAGTIARRIIELPDPYENMGAMLIRQMAWQVREKVGNGAATAATIAQALLHGANKQAASGTNVMMIRRGIEKGLAVAVASLKDQAVPMESPEQIEALSIAAAGGDREIGRYVAEMLEIIGTDGVLLVEESTTMRTDREYIEGLQWDSGYVSAHFCTDLDRMEAIIENPLVVATDLNIDRAEQLLPLLETIIARKQSGESFGGLVLFANEISGSALGLLATNHERDVLRCIGIKAPGAGDRRVRILEDISILSGGRLIAEDAGDQMESATSVNIGRARRVWCNRDFFSIIGGSGAPNAIRERIAEIKKLLPTAEGDFERDKMRERMGKLSGGVGVLKVGAPSERERETRKQRGEEAIVAARAAAEEGVVPGGGAAYLACVLKLREFADTLSRDEAIGVKVLIGAMEAPTEWIIRNSARDHRAILARLRMSPPGHGYDAVGDRIIDMTEAGILDPLKVVRGALEFAVSAGCMALTTEALILTDKSNPAVNP